MKRFKRWLLKVVEKWAGVYEEGPEVPFRILAQVPDFRVNQPQASVDDWELMAVNLARACWLEAYVRGYERRERVDDAWPDPAPDDIADYEFPGWRETTQPIPFEAYQPLEIEE